MVNVCFSNFFFYFTYSTSVFHFLSIIVLFYFFCFSFRFCLFFGGFLFRSRLGFESRTQRAFKEKYTTFMIQLRVSLGHHFYCYFSSLIKSILGRTRNMLVYCYRIYFHECYAKNIVLNIFHDPPIRPFIRLITVNTAVII